SAHLRFSSSDHSAMSFSDCSKNVSSPKLLMNSLFVFLSQMGSSSSSSGNAAVAAFCSLCSPLGEKDQLGEGECGGTAALLVLSTSLARASKTFFSVCFFFSASWYLR